MPKTWVNRLWTRGIRAPLALAQLDTRETNFIKLVGDPDWPQEKIKGELTAIRDERAQITGQLGDTTSKLEVSRQIFLSLLDLLADPQAFYERAGTSLRRAMNKVIFDRLYVDAEEITGHQLTSGAKPVVEANRASHTYGRRSVALSGLSEAPNASNPLDEEGVAELGRLTETDLLAMTLAGHGSSRPAMVGDTGIEPVTPTVSSEITDCWTTESPAQW